MKQNRREFLKVAGLAAVGAGLTWEPVNIAQSDGGTRRRRYDSEFGTETFFVICHNYCFCPFL